ncbi:small acid-soluble spore protein H (minor) [Melghiribacillus thermohalophilus]|uniref:Small, acid-soluble spore protein H n=1 Tax=Melghiribacillus thermohalophilus TaxID=1324956 RepID=A0A4R3NBV1_9BACI|nr:small acid-soluble spore protein H [Melghiribacillus thermohalophilus]TCT24569.1 small acid-soluble spore protein H (minor) [Melghiribacillus thermohalophilus]
MNTQRAKEIAESPRMIHVTYNGMPIFIQHVDEEQDMARIYPLDNPEHEQEVPVRQLKEENKEHF